MERIWTPKMQRARDKWRQRGNLAGIQVTESLSREDLAEKFKLEAEEKIRQQSQPTTVVYQSDEVIQETNPALYVLNYLMPEKKDKKRK